MDDKYDPVVVEGILGNQKSYIGRVLEKIGIRDELLGANEEMDKTSRFKRLNRIDESLISDCEYISYIVGVESDKVDSRNIERFSDLITNILQNQEKVYGLYFMLRHELGITD